MNVVALKPFLPSHLPLLAQWLRQPHVAPWYPEPDANLEWAASPPVGGSQAIIASGADEVGWLRWQRVDRETLDSLGLRDIPTNSVDADILIGDDTLVGRGLGPAQPQRSPRVRKGPAQQRPARLSSSTHSAISLIGWVIWWSRSAPGIGWTMLRGGRFRMELVIGLAYGIVLGTVYVFGLAPALTSIRRRADGRDRVQRVRPAALGRRILVHAAVWFRRRRTFRCAASGAR